MFHPKNMTASRGKMTHHCMLRKACNAVRVSFVEASYRSYTLDRNRKSKTDIAWAVLERNITKLIALESRALLERHSKRRRIKSMTTMVMNE